MIPALAVFVLLYAALLAVGALVVAVLRRRPGLGLIGGLVLLELCLLVQAVLDATDGRPAAEPTTHAAYLVTSVALLPMLVGLTRPAPAERVRAPDWTAAVLVVACVAIAVVDTRLVATGSDAFVR